MSSITTQKVTKALQFPTSGVTLSPKVVFYRTEVGKARQSAKLVLFSLFHLVVLFHHWRGMASQKERRNVLRRIAIIVSIILLAGILTTFLVIRQIVFGGTPTIRPRQALPLAVTPCATISLQRGARPFGVVSPDSTASYEASFQAAGQSLPGSVTGITGDVSGQFLLTQDEHIQSLQIVVDLRTLDSGSSDRDSHVRNDTLETNTYPYATFRVTDASVLSGHYVEGQNVTFQLNGELTLHGITRPEIFSMQGRLTGNTITGTASALVHLQDFQMKPPQTTSVVTITVNNAVTLSINFTAKKQTCSH